MSPLFSCKDVSHELSHASWFVQLALRVLLCLLLCTCFRASCSGASCCACTVAPLAAQVRSCILLFMYFCASCCTIRPTILYRKNPSQCFRKIRLCFLRFSCENTKEGGPSEQKTSHPFVSGPLLRQGLSVIIDRTNINAEQRSPWVELARDKART